MSEDWWDRVSAVLERAASAPAVSRAALLESLCAGDDALRAEVESLLGALETEADRFEQPAADLLAVLPAEGEPALAAGRTVGPYLIVRELGHGGMGSVFEAHRTDDDFRKRVALKTLSVGRSHSAVLRRFRQERRILARLDHRHIAALLDGGVLPDGVPYFAMEYVEGEPIDRYCEARGLPEADRLRLMRQVCGAVHFAHQNLVVHRDLKPSNILVTPDGTVKLLDFGIAKLLADDDDTADPDLTVHGESPYTTAYASPEQLRGDPITTASDVHALGVVLYQVLTGRHPFRDADTPRSEVRRRIEEQDPPSTGRGADLDAIVRTALHKDPARRYASAEQLAEDLRRHLEKLPVQARPDTLGYRASKFVRRNRVAVAASAVAAVALAFATAVSAHQARVASIERDRARIEATKANRVTAFVQDMLRSADPREAGSELTVAQALAAATARADSTLSTEPEILASVLSAIGLSYVGLGRYDDAEPRFRRALELRQQLALDREVAASMHQLALVHLQRGEIEPADTLFRASVAEYRALAEPDSAGLADALNDMGDLLQYVGDLEASERAHREALAIRLAQGGERSPAVATSLNNLSVIEGQMGNWVEAERLEREALSIVRERYGDRHPDVAAGLNVLAFAVESQGRVAEAEASYREALEIRLATLGPDHPETVLTYMNLGWLLHDDGRFPDALAEAERVLALRGSVLTDDHPAVGSTLTMKGQSLVKLGRHAEAEAALRDALRIREAALPAGHWLIAASQSALAESLALARQFSEAERLLLAALPVLAAERGEDQELTVLARTRLVALYEAWGRPEQAARYRGTTPGR